MARGIASAASSVTLGNGRCGLVFFRPLAVATPFADARRPDRAGFCVTVRAAVFAGARRRFGFGTCFVWTGFSFSAGLAGPSCGGATLLTEVTPGCAVK